MSSTNPYFTIIIPTYNRAHLIKQTLSSVLAQTFADYEVLIIDDGGRDNTEEVVKSLNSAKVFYFRKENGERGAARNFGWEMAKGIYVTFLDSDDVVYPCHLEEAHRFLTRKPETTCYAQAYEIKTADKGELLVRAYQSKTSTINKEIIKGNFLSCFGVFVKREVLRDVRFEEERRFAGSEDWLLWLQLAARFPFYYNNEVTGAMLEHDHRSVLSFSEESLQYRAEFLKARLTIDDAFIQMFKEGIVNKIYAHMLSYSSLHLAMNGNKKKALTYWLKAVTFNIGEVFTRRSLAITKKLIFH
jgi:glycosyltransferase involved in cell wall biosynthesis